MRKILTIFTILFLSNAFDAQIPEDHLQLYYPFNNNANDLSGNDFHGSSIGANIITDKYVNSYYSFNGAGDYIRVPNAAKIKPDFPFSISLWVKIDNFSNQSSVIYASDEKRGIFSGFWIGYLPTGEVSAGYGDGLGTGSEHRITKHSGITISNTKWHNIIAVFNDLNDIDLFIDGQGYSGRYSGSASKMMNLGSNGTIGRSLGHHAKCYHNGKIDDIRIYNKSLNGFEIDALFNEYNPMVIKNDLKWYNKKVTWFAVGILSGFTSGILINKK